MNSTTDAYKKNVWQFLNKMKPGERHIVSKLCVEENTEIFLNHIKEWMSNWPYQGGLSFNHDYSEFYMSHVPHEAPKRN